MKVGGSFLIHYMISLSYDEESDTKYSYQRLGLSRSAILRIKTGQGQVTVLKCD